MTINRVAELDGIRGWASLSVVLYHVIYETMSPRFTSMNNIILTTLLNGELAVMIFFVLSGDALSISYWAGGGKKSVAKAAVKRYPRLAIPVLFACSIVYAINLFDLNFSNMASQIEGNLWLASISTNSSSITGLFQYALLYVFYKPLDNPYIIFLWTMKTEMIGSILLFGYLILERKVLFKKCLLLSLFILFWYLGFLFSCFFAGALISLMRSEGIFSKLSESKAVVASAFLVLFCSLTISGFANMYETSFRQTNILCATLMMMAIQLCPPIKVFLSGSLSSWLGKISFPLYLTHCAVIISITSKLIIDYSTISANYHVAFVAIAVISIIASLIFAQIFTVVEYFTNMICKIIWKSTPHVI